MLRTIFRGRNLSRLLVAFASAGAIVAVPTAASAHHTDNPYGYNDICPGYDLREYDTLAIRQGSNVVIGRVQIGYDDASGKVCVATIKVDDVAGHDTYLKAEVATVDDSDGDDGNYGYFAGPVTVKGYNKTVYYEGVIEYAGTRYGKRGILTDVW